MSGNSRFVTTNVAVASTTSIKNGTGGGAPALDESTGFAMTNALYSDRYTLWKTAAAPASPLYFDLDLGAGTIPSITSAAIHGLRPSGSCVLGSVVVTSGAAYSPPATARGTITVGAITPGGANARDFGVTFAATTDRYWRFAFTFTTVSTGFSLGKLMLGAMRDLGKYYGPQSGDSPVRFRSVMRTPAGHPLITDLGDEGREIPLVFPTLHQTIDSSARATLLALADQRASFTYIDPEDKFYECMLQDHKTTRKRIYTATDSFVANMEILP